MGEFRWIGDTTLQPGVSKPSIVIHRHTCILFTRMHAKS